MMMMMTNSSILSQQCNDPISYSQNQKVAMTKTSNHQKKSRTCPDHKHNCQLDSNPSQVATTAASQLSQLTTQQPVIFKCG